MCILPNIWNPAKSGMLFNLGVDAICELTWEDTVRQLEVRRARRAIARANVLLGVRFSDTMCMAGADDGSYNLDLVTEKFGTKFHPVNFHGLMDQMNPLPKGGNPTTPGRVTPDLTAEEIRDAVLACEIDGPAGHMSFGGSGTCNYEIVKTYMNVAPQGRLRAEPTDKDDPDREGPAAELSVPRLALCPQNKRACEGSRSAALSRRGAELFPRAFRRETGRIKVKIGVAILCRPLYIYFNMRLSFLPEGSHRKQNKESFFESGALKAQPMCFG